MTQYIFLESLDYEKLVDRLNQLEYMSKKKKLMIVKLNGRQYDLSDFDHNDQEELNIIIKQVSQVYNYPELTQVDQTLNMKKFLYAEYRLAQLKNGQIDYDIQNIRQCCVCQYAVFTNNSLFEEAIELPCIHVIHTQCAYKLVKQTSLQCPICYKVHKTPEFINSECVGCLNLTLQNSVLFRRMSKEMKLTFLFLKKFNQYLTQDYEVNILLPFNNEGEQVYQKIEASFYRGKLFRKLYMKANQHKIFDETIIQPKFAVLNKPQDLANYNNSEDRYLDVLSRQMDMYLEK